MIRLLKILGWTILALILLVAGSLTVAVRLLHPARLTPLVQAAANRYLNADVSLGRAELNLSRSFPFLEIQLDDLTVTSRDISSMPDSARAVLPAYADTLLTLGQLKGSINLSALLKNEIQLGNVTFTSPGVNIVTVSENLNNFNIVPPSEDDDTPSPIPAISIQRFAIVDPRPFRYYNHADGSRMELDMTSVIIDGADNPRYTCDFRGALPLEGFDIAALSEIPFSISGDVEWNPETPQRIGLENFDFDVSMLGGRFDTHMDFGDNLIVQDFQLKLKPLPLGDILDMLPPDLAAKAGLPEGLATTARPEIEIILDRPYDTASGSIPHATVNMVIPSSTITYDGTKFHNFTLEVSAQAFGDDIDRATVKLNSFTLAGDATDIRLSGTVTNMMTDPLFDGNFRGNMDLKRLPRSLTRLIPGYASGKIDARLRIAGRPSMFAPGNYYRLAVAGEFNGRELYWLSPDTADMAYIHHAKIHFGNDETFRSDSLGQVKLLHAVIDVDSVNVLHTQYSFKATGFHLGAATRNQRYNADTTAITPMGGGLKIASFDFRLLSDTIMVRAREIDGNVAMRAADGDVHRPKFDFDLTIRRLSTGDPSTRFMLSKADVNFSAMKLPRREPPREFVRTADSIRDARPDLPMDSVYAIAMEKYRHKRRGMPRVHAQITDTDDEIIDWGTSKQLRQLLLGWKLNGHIQSRRVSLFTPYFPMRNRIRNFNVTFNNDSIKLDNIEYKVGHSDFLLSGQISNLRRGLTSKTHRQSVKANFDVLSDTIDVNQLADLAFRGAAYSESSNKHSLHLDDIDSDDKLESEIDRYVAGAGDSVAPLLIPKNVEAVFNIKANNILYSDLTMHNLSGTALMYGGALNLHNLRASSDVGSVALSALYQAPNVNDLSFGFGLEVKRFDIHGFLRMVPAIDSIMPLIKDFDGIIDADIAATVGLYRNMDFDMPSLHAAVNITGDSLQLIDAETYRTIGKWLMFKDKHDNIIKHMSVEMVVDSSMMEIYPFVFDIDRYRLGVQGYNDLDMNFNYHIAVLKSPLPFKFGINIKGNPDDYKIRLGGAKFNEKQAIERVAFTDTTRVNLIRQIENVFRRGVDNSRFSRLRINARPTAAEIDLNTDTLTRADSVRLIQEGLIPAPPGFLEPPAEKKTKKLRIKKDKRKAYIHGQIQESIVRLYAALPEQRHAPGRPVRYGRHTV
ncbi:MAG: AsmA family protein [Muribaculaceae bacterium]|nr:AsmA family protein [Muribaculaceae bacterium]